MWKDDAGTTFVAMKQGARLLEIAPGKRAIEVGPLEDLPGQLAIRQAVVAGELDAVIGPMVTPRGSPNKKLAGAATKPANAKA